MHLDKKRAPLLLHWDKKRAPLISSEQLKAWKQLTNSHTANCCSPLFRETFAADSGTRGGEDGGEGGGEGGQPGVLQQSWKGFIFGCKGAMISQIFLECVHFNREREREMQHDLSNKAKPQHGDNGIPRQL